MIPQCSIHGQGHGFHSSVIAFGNMNVESKLLLLSRKFEENVLSPYLKMIMMQKDSKILRAAKCRGCVHVQYIIYTLYIYIYISYIVYIYTVYRRT